MAKIGVRELKADGVRPTDIANALKIGWASVYRLLAQSRWLLVTMARLHSENVGAPGK
jgi:hypothetical protein